MAIPDAATMKTLMGRRGFLRSVLAAPLVVRTPGLLMPISVFPRSSSEWLDPLGVGFQTRFTMADVPELLRPGLEEVIGSYGDYAEQWMEVFDGVRVIGVDVGAGDDVSVTSIVRVEVEQPALEPGVLERRIEIE